MVSTKNVQIMDDKMKPIQLEYTNLAKEKILDWAKEKTIKLIYVDFIIPFIATNKELTVFFFFDNDKSLNKYLENGTTKVVSTQFLKILKESGYPTDYFEFVNFQNDTKENVDKNFGGKYFYRLR